MSMDLSGELLVASPQMGDWFARTVILVVEHNEEGAFGLVLNRPSESTVAEAVPDIAPAVGGDHVLHVGGPVAPDSVTAIGEHEEPGESAKLVVGPIGMVDLENPPDLARLRLFAGYAGWSPGQLDQEVADDAWIIETAHADDIFAEDEDLDLWAKVLDRKGGEYSLLARMPSDPSVN